MQSYALIVACPVAILSQHFYSETMITFKRKSSTIVMLYILGITLLTLWLSIFHIVSIISYIEFFLANIIGIVIGKFINKFEERREIENFERSELIVIGGQISVGIVWCIFPFTELFNKYVTCKYPYNDAFFSTVLYITLGCTFIFYNRLFFTMIYKKSTNYKR